MKIGLVGFAGSGKTTVFNTMTGLAVLIGYGGEVRLGAVRVPDERIDALSKIFAPKKTTYAEMSFCDIPGEHGAERKGLSHQGAAADSRTGRALPRAERFRESGRRRPAACGTPQTLLLDLASAPLGEKPLAAEPRFSF